MSIDVTVTHLSGSKSNQVETVRGLPLWLGRAEKCKVRFDPEIDTRVSALHAELRQTEDGKLEIADLDSRNGVLVDGVKIEGSAIVPNRGVVELGAGGPRLRLEFAEGGGVSFQRMRRDTARRLDKNKGEPRPLVSTDDGIPIYDLKSLEADGGYSESNALVTALVAGVVLGVIGLLVVLAMVFLA